MLTIVTPAPDRNLLTAAEMRSAAGLESTDTSQDTELAALNGYISAVIARECNVSVEDLGDTPPTLRSETVTETFRSGTYQNVLALTRFPVTALSTVVENDGTLTSATPDYILDGQLLYRVTGGARGWWPNGTASVTYIAGWATVPDDLKWAAIKFAKGELAVASTAVLTGGDSTLKRLKIEGVSEREWAVTSSSSEADDSSSSTLPADVYNILKVGGYIRQFGHMR